MDALKLRYQCLKFRFLFLHFLKHPVEKSKLPRAKKKCPASEYIVTSEIAIGHVDQVYVGCVVLFSSTLYGGCVVMFSLALCGACVVLFSSALYGGCVVLFSSALYGGCVVMFSSVLYGGRACSVVQFDLGLVKHISLLIWFIWHKFKNICELSVLYIAVGQITQRQKFDRV